MSINILDFSEQFQYERDSGGISSILRYVIKLKQANVIIYGAGDDGYQKLFWLRRRKIEPIYIVDQKADNHTNEFFGCPIIHPNELKKRIKNKRIIAIIATNCYKYSFDRENIARVLIEANVLEIFDFDIKNFPHGTWAKYYAENHSEIESLVSDCCDQKSKDTLTEYIRCVMQDDFYRGYSLATNTKYIADDVFLWKNDETIISCGMALGDTIFHISAIKPFKKIYGIESETKTFNQANSFLSLLKNSIYEKIETMNTFISEENTIDIMFAAREISLICLDAEGSELDVLRSGEKLIKSQAPVLAVCLYHKKEDIVEIPKYIRTLGEYRFYVRKYEPWKAEVSMGELVLYAVPGHRRNKDLPTDI